MALRDRLGQKLVGALAACVMWSSRHAAAVVAGFLVLTVLGGALTATRLGVNTDTSRMISSELPFRQSFMELIATFPALDNNIVAVVEADDPDRAREAARSLVQSFRAHPDLFDGVYAPGVGDFFDTHGLLYLDQQSFARVADRIASSAPILGALAARPDLAGLAGLTDRLAAGAGAGRLPEEAGAFFASLARVVDGQMDATPVALDWTGLFAGGTGPEQTRWYVFVKPALDYSRLDPAGPALEEARRIVADPEVTFSGEVRIRLTGEAALNAEEMETVMRGATLAGIVSFVLVGLILAFGIRSGRQVIAALSMLAVGLVLTATAATVTVGYLNLISVAFAVLFVGLGIDYAIHFGLRYEEERRVGHAHEEALRQTAHGVGSALLLCTATTAIGFLAFTPTDFVGMAQLGLISSAGMLVALVCATTFLPALLTLLPPQPPRRHGALSAVSEPLLRLLSGRRFRFGVTVTVILAALASLAAVPMARFDGDPLNLKAPGEPAVTAFRDLLADTDAPVYTAEILADTREEAEAFARRFEALPEVAGVVTIDTFVPEGQADRLDRLSSLSSSLPRSVSTDDPGLAGEARRAALTRMESALGRIAGAQDVAEDTRQAAESLRGRIAAFLDGPGREAGAPARLERAVFHGLPGAVARLNTIVGAGEVDVAGLEATLRSRFVSPEGRYRIEILPRADLADPGAMERFVQAVRTVSWNVTGSPVEIVGAAGVVSESMLFATVLAAGLIALVLFAMLSRVLDVVLVLLPITLAGAILVAATVLLDIPFNFANVIVLPLLIGLGVDSGIHLVMRAREETEGRAGEPAGHVLASSTPRAVFLSALTTVSSFGTLALSAHRGTASMGELLMIAIALTLVCTLVVLPTLVDWSARALRRRKG